MFSRAMISLTALLVLGLGASATSAAPLRCESSVNAWGRAPNGLNFDPPRTYDTVSLARARAVSNWKMRVRANCPDHSTFWWRAVDKSVSCEGYAGGAACNVRARPAHKLFR